VKNETEQYGTIVGNTKGATNRVGTRLEAFLSFSLLHAVCHATPPPASPLAAPKRLSRWDVKHCFLSLSFVDAMELRTDLWEIDGKGALPATTKRYEAPAVPFPSSELRCCWRT